MPTQVQCHQAVSYFYWSSGEFPIFHRVKQCFDLFKTPDMRKTPERARPLHPNGVYISYVTWHGFGVLGVRIHATANDFCYTTETMST